MTAALTREALLRLSTPELAFLASEARWRKTARRKQIAPATPWTTWALLAGRGFGKSVTGNQWVREKAWTMPASIGHVIAPTSGDLIGTTFEGPVGLMKVIPEHLIRNYVRTPFPLITLVNESLIRGFAADTPDRLRGPQSHYALCEEMAAWMYLMEAWANIVFSTRLPYVNKHGIAIPVQYAITTTPRPIPFLRKLAADAEKAGSGIIITRGTTYENRANLDASFFNEIAKYEGTQLGRQEIHGEILDPSDSGIIKRSWLRTWPMSKGLPALEFVVLSFDTAFTEASMRAHPESPDAADRKRRTADPTAATAWGVFVHEKRYCFILLDHWSELLGFPDLVSRARRESKYRWGQEQPQLIIPRYDRRVEIRQGRGVDLMLIEDKGSGISLRQTLDGEGLATYPYNPGLADKTARLHAVSHIPFAGRIFVPDRRPKPTGGVPIKREARDETPGWADEWHDQVCVFAGKGTTEHDDYVDSTSQAWRYLGDRFVTQGVTNKDDVKGREDREARDRVPQYQENPYAA